MWQHTWRKRQTGQNQRENKSYRTIAKNTIEQCDAGNVVGANGLYAHYLMAVSKLYLTQNNRPVGLRGKVSDKAQNSRHWQMVIKREMKWGKNVGVRQV